MRGLLARATAGQFKRDVAKLAGGTSLAQLLLIASAPVLTRLFSPADLGTLAVFSAVTMMVAGVSCGRYELAIVRPDDDEDAVNLLVLSLFLCLLTSTLLLLALLPLVPALETRLDQPSTARWFLLAAPAVFFMGAFSALKYFATRHGRFGAVAQAEVGKTVVMTGAQVTAGLLGFGAPGLLVGNAVSTVASNGRLVLNALRVADFRSVTSTRMRHLAREYSSFPLLSAPAVLANQGATQGLNILAARYYSLANLGYLSILQRLLGLPITLVGQAVGQVYYQRASRITRGNDAVRFFDRTVISLALVAVPVFGILALVAPGLFEFVFGEGWATAGEYARILAPFFAVRFVVHAVTTTMTAYDRQGLFLVWQVVLLVSSLSSVIIAGALSWDFVTFLYLYSGSSTICYLSLSVMMRRVARGVDR